MFTVTAAISRASLRLTLSASCDQAKSPWCTRIRRIRIWFSSSSIKGADDTLLTFKILIVLDAALIGLLLMGIITDLGKLSLIPNGICTTSFFPGGDPN